MANFAGRLALHVADRDAGMGVEFGHFSTSLTDLRTASLLLGSSLTGDFESPEPSALSTLDQQDMERQVRQVMSELAERDRGLLRCVLMEDRDKGEICAEFGVTREHLRVLVHRAKQSFKTSYIRKLGAPKDLGA